MPGHDVPRIARLGAAFLERKTQPFTKPSPSPGRTRCPRTDPKTTPLCPIPNERLAIYKKKKTPKSFSYRRNRHLRSSTGVLVKGGGSFVFPVLFRLSNTQNSTRIFIHPACCRLFCLAGPTAAAGLQRRGLCRSSAQIRQTGPGPGRRRPIRRTKTHRNDAQGVHVDHRTIGQAQGGPEARLFQVRIVP